ncbi:hypothetical protein WJX81_004787 [Elliptochloris bilobata]|uniref:Lipoprotein n=1 Tax=Elliptochloris bilobata TaxID=381761 RepID=A0AAW1RNM1_9CHLO
MGKVSNTLSQAANRLASGPGICAALAIGGGLTAACTIVHKEAAKAAAGRDAALSALGEALQRATALSDRVAGLNAESVATKSAAEGATSQRVELEASAAKAQMAAARCQERITGLEALA